VILVIATHTAGKLREYGALLDGLGIELRAADAPQVEEAAETYLDNARAKARAVAAHTGCPAVGDDSGLEVDALGGAPGVRSARFATGGGDAANTALLLERLRSTPTAARTARFRCAIVVVRADGAELIANGTCEGRITEAPRGTRGFGYDPVFFYPPLGRTFAELGPEEKDTISHRARAVAALRPRLREFLLLQS
jgi:XTP/dITP diphosphohydrolase